MVPHRRLLERLVHYMTLLDSHCPVERHELTDYEWTLLGIITSERNLILAEEAKRQQRG